MATNNDNACYAVALYNALEPFVAIHTQFVDRVHISSSQPLSSDIGLKYILAISNFIDKNTFNSNQINLYIDLTELDKDDYEQLYDWIHFSDEDSDATSATKNILDNIHERIAEAFGKPINITQGPGLDVIITGIKSYYTDEHYTHPLVFILNCNNGHYITLFTFPDSDPIIVNDGRIERGPRIYSMYSANIFTIGVVCPIDPEFTTEETINTIYEIYGGNLFATQVIMHTIRYNAQTKELKIGSHKMHQWLM